MKCSPPLGLYGLEEIGSSGDGSARPDTERRRWTQAENFNPRWNERVPIVVEFTDAGAWVCDIGCGPVQALRDRFHSPSRYFPADLMKWTPDTETCDLNSGTMPRRSLGVADTGILLGVLEYIEEPERLLRRIADYVDCLILSYHPADYTPKIRNAPPSRKMLSLAEIRSALGCASETRLHMHSSSEVIVRYDIPATALKTLRRQIARLRLK